MRQTKWVVACLALSGVFLVVGCRKPAPESVTLAVQTEGQGTTITDPPAGALAPGTVVTVTASAAPGAHFDHWSGGLSGSDNPATFTLREDTSITAVFAPNEYTLAYAAGGGGHVDGPAAQTVLYGAAGAPVTAVADTGYHFVQWSDGARDNPRTDHNVTADLAVAAEFAIDTFTLNYTAGDHGHIDGPVSQTVDYGADGVPVTAVPDTGYHFVQWSDGATDNPRTDTNITADFGVTADFAIDTFTLAYAAGDHGHIDGPVSQTVDYGADGTPVTAVADTGYHFVKWSDGATGNPRTDTNVTADLAVTAEFAIDTFTLIYSAGAHGHIDGPAAQTVDYGADGVRVTAVPDEHCHFVQWSDGVATAARTDLHVTADLAVTALFALDTRMLSYAAGEHGHIDGPAQQTVDYGADGATVTAVADTGWHFVQWSDGLKTPARTDLNVTEDLAVSAEFAINVYALNYSAGEHGSLSGATSQSVTHGGDGTTVTAVPDAGCRFVQWSDGITTAARTDTGVAGDIDVTADFAEGIVVHVSAASTAAAPDGLSWETAYPDLQGGVDAAPVNAQVWVAEGTYTSVADTVLNMRAAVLVYGGFAGTEVYRDQRDWNAHKSVIDGQDARRCVNAAAYAALDGFTVTRGYADSGGGGGMLIVNDSPVVARCTFANNAAYDAGGGLCNVSGSPFIEECVFQGNSSQSFAGGLYAGGEGRPVLNDCLFLRNTALSAQSAGVGGAICGQGTLLEMNRCLFAENEAFYGGGVVLLSGGLVARNCVFLGNRASVFGGGCMEANSSGVMDSCFLAGNTAQEGGALFTQGGDWSLDNCILQDNRATDEGGAINDNATSLDVRNSTFTGNRASVGGAISGGSVKHLTNCIFWGDTASSIGPEVYPLPASYGSLMTYSCIQGGCAGTGNIDADPMFVDPEGGSLYLLPGSPCLDTGTGADAPDTDILDRPRPDGAGVDMGAYEGAATDLVTLTIQASPEQGGTTWPEAGTHRCVRGETVLLAAIPAGMRFTGWTGDITADTLMASIVMDGDKSVTAEFALNVVYVNAAAQGVEDGKSWATAFHDIQTAVDAAPADNTGEVWVAEGTYTSTAQQVVTLKRGLLLYGGFAGDETGRDQRDWNAHPSVIDGEDARRGVLGADSALLDGFTITRGFDSIYGGGMYIDSVTPVVRHCAFTCNSASYGGAMAAMNGNLRPVVSDCVFEGNEAGQYGGALFGMLMAPTLERCTFISNTAAYGGAVSCQDADNTTVSDGTFLRNRADYGGGGLYIMDSTLHLHGCALVGNAATNGEGGAIFDLADYGYGGVSAENCLFVRNTATGSRGYGGAVRPAGAFATSLTNCTFTQNTALAGGALGCDYTGGVNLPSPLITNCILWGDRAMSESPEIYTGSASGYYSVAYSCIQGGFAGDGNIDADPLFVDGPGGSVQLREGSPCLNTGVERLNSVFGPTIVAPEDDFLGRPRPEGAGVDMGAYEGAFPASDFVTLTIEVSPADGGHAQPELGTHTYVRGDTAHVTALPLGMRFTGWSGDAAGTALDLALVMDSDKTVTAEFVPNVVYVNFLHLTPSDGRTWATAFGSLYDAVSTAAADGGGEVWVAQGSYNVSSKTGLVLKPGVFLYGGFMGGETDRSARDWNKYPTLLKGSANQNVLIVGADDAVLDGFTITEAGMGLYNRGCSPAVRNCLFTANVSLYWGSGGICNEGASPTIQNCTFAGNRGMYSGGMCNIGGAPQVVDCLFSGNSSTSWGGGMYSSGSSARIVRCVFTGNTASFGGGMLVDSMAGGNEKMRVEDCVFSANAATYGGGICGMKHNANDARLKVTNTVCVQNSAAYGGGVCASGDGTALVNCTITANAAPVSAEASRGGGFYQDGGDATMTNCIVWGNTAAEGPEVYVASGTLAARYTCMPLGFGDDGTFYLNPLFVDAANGDVRLLPGSPCIDTGTPDGAPAADIEGTPRPQGSGFDIGAYEQ